MAYAKLDERVRRCAGRGVFTTKENGKTIDTEQDMRGGDNRPLRRFIGCLLALTLCSVLLLGCTATSPVALPETAMPVPSSLAAIQGNTLDAGGPATGDVPGSSPSVDSIPMEMESAKAAQTPIYWLGATDSDVYLYREFQDAPHQGDPITTALTAMTSAEPLDADYFNPWQPASAIGASISGKNLITVDISADAFEHKLDAGMAHRAVQQLVFTATAAAASSGLMGPNQQIQVVVLVDGRSGYEAFGHIRLGQPMVRDTALVAPIWVIDPQEDASYPEPTVTVNGRGISADSRLRWQLLIVGERSDSERFTTVHSSGYVRLGNGTEQAGAFGFTLQLPPAVYELRVFDRGPAGKDQFTDSKVFTVR